MTETLASALLAFQKDAPTIPKDATNPHFRSKFASLDGLMDKARPVLNRHGLVITQHPTTLDGEPALRTRLVHAPTGESLEDTMLLLLGKTDPQGQGSAITYARRYALMATLGLTADDDDDGHAATPAPTARTGVAAPQSAGRGIEQVVRPSDFQPTPPQARKVVQEKNKLRALNPEHQLLTVDASTKREASELIERLIQAQSAPKEEPELPDEAPDELVAALQNDDESLPF